MTEKTLPRVAVCVATRRRPDGLAKLLESLASQTFRDFMVVVVENDATASCESLCCSLAKRLDLDIRYQLQSTGGIPHVRNRAVSAVPAGVEWIAFVDDDEVAEPDWLANLLTQAEASGVDVVTGPVIPIYHDSIPQWLREGGYFEPTKSLPTGQLVSVARSGNALVRRHWFDQFRFDERLKESGGSDTQFFLQIFGAGAQCIWCAEAAVFEFVPAERGTTAWLLRRSFRYGNTLAVLDRLNGRSLTLRAAKGVALLILGTLRFAAGILIGRDWRLRGRIRIARGLGTLRGVIGHVERAYPVDA